MNREQIEIRTCPLSKHARWLSQAGNEYFDFTLPTRCRIRSDSGSGHKSVILVWVNFSRDRHIWACTTERTDSRWSQHLHRQLPIKDVMEVSVAAPLQLAGYEAVTARKRRPPERSAKKHKQKRRLPEVSSSDSSSSSEQPPSKRRGSASPAPRRHTTPSPHRAASHRAASYRAASRTPTCASEVTAALPCAACAVLERQIVAAATREESLRARISMLEARDAEHETSRRDACVMAAVLMAASGSGLPLPAVLPERCRTAMERNLQ